MRSHRMNVATSHRLACGFAFAGLLVSVTASTVLAGQRQFLVMLATSPKQNGLDPALPNPQAVENVYFNGPNSFAEYWKQISYGDVTVSGQVTDWVQLPWSVQPRVSPGNFIDLNLSGKFEYGRGEPFENSNSMLGRDLFGTNSGATLGEGADDETPTGTPVWTPGERFVDMDGDSLWDGLDEARNEMDWDGNGQPDLAGPWIDLDGDGVPANARNCIYLTDSDNDGNPNCCPNGPSRPGCAGRGVESGQQAENSCPPTTWENADGNTIVDCNGNLLDDTDDVLSGRSKDELPFASDDRGCSPGAGDGIPDECQFSNWREDCRPANLNCPVDGDQDACCGNTVCTPLSVAEATILDRCEYHDVNENGRMDIVEPFENALVRLTPGGSCPSTVSDAYIRDNFPGHPDQVIARHAVRTISGMHDPNGKITDSRQRKCNGGIGPAYGADGLCVAGEHAEYNPPDQWTDGGAATTKMFEGEMADGTITPQPIWYEQAWKDRYGNVNPPAWKTPTKTAGTFPATARLGFSADRGGTTGHGSGWIGCDDDGDGSVRFASSGCNGNFEQLCNARILPDELNGIGQRLTLYDGPVEHDDLPSSKYHGEGDKNLGEVTSPFSDAIFGQDRGTNDPNSISVGPDFVLPAAGPYATQLHGQLGRDAGNVLQLELLTRRTEAPFNIGTAWAAVNGSHPYAERIGFRDYNLDGAVDRGEVTPAGSENYLVDPYTQGNRAAGTDTAYPWNRRRLIEDVVQIVDDFLDFDDFVDPVGKEAVECAQGLLSSTPPPPFASFGAVAPAGVCSGIVLLPPGTSTGLDFLFSPGFYGVHNEDGLGDAGNELRSFPRAPSTPQLSWNLFFHDLVWSIGQGGESGTGGGPFEIGYAAHEYLHAWEGLPDLYDYDVFDNPVAESCHVGFWDIMANGGLVHPTPVLKEASCPRWIEPVDLTTVLTPGVDKLVTLPSAETIRDSSYYYLENEDRRGERYWFWSAGSGFDTNLPAAGMLVMHTDVGSNPDALPPQQRSGDRPQYAIVQADGLSQLAACDNRGDAGDPFPGSAGKRSLDCETFPANEWYTDNSCTGLELRSITLDGSGSASVVMNWTPTTVPSLRFVDPPGGVTVGNPPTSIYNVRAEANDVYGGTRVRFFYTTSESQLPDPTASTSHAISLIRKTTPGNTELSADWNVSGLTDGRYYLFADLIPAAGADGIESKLTNPRPGRSNLGSASLRATNVEVSTSTLNAAGEVATQGRARSETWTMRCINSTTGEWVVNSSLTLPVPASDAANQDPYSHAITGQRYLPAPCTGTGAGRVCGTPIEGIAFTIQQGTGASPRGAVGDTFTFTTTGITARSEGVSVRGGRISEDPIATIDATPLSGLPPLAVSFDARRSVDPNGAPLTYRWDFGDNSPPATGAQVTHTYSDAGTFAASLRATNSAGRFGETSVDIRVINNTPNAVIRATPNSGLAPLVVAFNASQSSDAETPPEQLIYQWEFGDGTSANDARVAGLSFREVSHTYSRQADGTQCSVAAPCTFTAKLTVIDAGGVSDAATTTIRIGNTNPVPNVTFTTLTGATPLTVTFNAKNSTDAENDPIQVEWIWGDGTNNETYRAVTGKPPATDGSVPHTFLLPAGASTRSFTVRAILRDLTAAGARKGGETSWPGVTVTVTAFAPPENHTPTARFTVTPEVGIIGEDLTFDASTSTDADGDDLRYRWDFGDGTSTNFGVNPVSAHSYDEAGTFTVRLTVEDENGATATAVRSVRILSEGTNRAPIAIVATGPRTGPAPLSQTFDGRLSYDPDGDALSYLWGVYSNDLLIDTLTGQVATRSFTTQGTFTVTLTVRDVRGGEDVADPVTVVVAGEVVPPDDPEPPRPEPEEPPDSANQRPTPVVCGLGMMAAFFGTFTGLGLTAVLRRNRNG